MQQSAHLQSVVDVINEWKTTRHKPFDHILNQYFRDRRFIGSKDRQQISWLCYEVFRHKLILEWWAEWGMKKPCIEAEEPYAIKVLAIYLSLVRKKSPGEIHALFTGEKYGVRPLERIERQMIETIWKQPTYGKDPLHHDLMPEHIRLNTPKWIYDVIMEGDTEGKAMLSALNYPATIDLRVNTLKTDRDSILMTFNALGVESLPTLYSQWGLRIQKRFNLNTLDAYKTGLVEIQDEGSQILCQVTNPKPNTTVIDYCAGAGGKSLAMAMMMNNKGKLILCDTASWRLEKSNERLRKAGVFNVQQKIVLETPEGDEAVLALTEKADTVLVDAPCSGTGTWRRNPDARFRLSQKELDELIEIQAKILNESSFLVKQGGCLVYATCSIVSSENQHQVNRFLESHADFKLESIEFNGATHEMLNIRPHTYRTDGFFVARLRRVPVA
jgi:16S rRNA (cytosine967-C5)-methyltransferase